MLDGAEDGTDFDASMEWSNEKVLLFLKLFRGEPCLWDPRLKSYKNRVVQKKAWHRIVQALQFPVTIDVLKKKKNSLMGYYRIHLNKHKRSRKTGAGINEIYSTNWFAFTLMDSFLRPVYENTSTLNAGVMGTSSDATVSELSDAQDDDCLNYSIPSTPSTSRDPSSSRQAIRRPSTTQSNCKSTGQHHSVKKVVPLEIIAAQKHINEAFDNIKSLTSPNKKNDPDEYDHFGMMIAAKIRKMNDPFDRESLMNAIQNLVFQSITKNS